MKNLFTLILLFKLTALHLSCFGQDDDDILIGRQFYEPGFSIEFYDIHSKLYGYDHNKYPKYVQEGFNREPSTIIHKINAKGDSLWTKIYPQSLQGSAIAATNDRGFVITGYKPTNRTKTYKNDRTQAVTLLRIDSTGNLLWFKIIPSDYNSTSDDIVVSNTNEIFLLADHEYPPTSDFKLNPQLMRLVKLNDKGDIMWDKDIPNPYKNFYIPSKLISDNKGALFIIGTNNSSREKAYIAQLDTSGKILKEKEFYWSYSEYSKEMNWAFSLISVSDGLVFSCSALYGKDAHHIVKIDSNFEKQWEKTQDCKPIDESALLANDKNEVYFAGNTENYDLVITKYGNSGNLIWEKIIRDPGIFKTSSALLLKTGNIVIVGSSHTSGQSDWVGQYYILDAEGKIIEKKK